MDTTMPGIEFTPKAAGRRRFLPLIVAAAATVCTFATADAGGLYRQHVYADSFGNLIVYSPSGYKRIVVGKGYLADEVRANNADVGPKVVYLHDGRRGVRRSGCERHAVLLHGRSYMYGLPDNVVPEPAAATCE